MFDFEEFAHMASVCKDRLFGMFYNNYSPSSLLYIDIRDLDIVIKELMSTQRLSCVVWRDLGLQLGLYDPTLVEIDEKCRGNPVQCFRECMSAWLRKEDKVRDTDGPSWLSLVSALHTIGEHHIATNIERKYC